IRREWNEEDKEYLLKILSYYKQYLTTKEGVFMIDTDNLNPEEVINEMRTLITQLSGYSFERLEKPISTQMNLSKFLD
ncbi:MAG: hypothetical protein ACFE75_12720, partial [Candidatus Hodarchaeota archaeon]